MTYGSFRIYTGVVPMELCGAVASVCMCSCCIKISVPVVEMVSGLALVSMNLVDGCASDSGGKATAWDCSQPLSVLPRALSRWASLGRYHEKCPQQLKEPGQGRQVGPSYVT